MTLKERLTNDMKEAMKAKETERRDTIRYVLSAFQNAEIEKKGDLTEEEQLSVVRKQVKQRQDSIGQFRQGGRDDLADKDEAQLKIIEQYLPQQMSDEELDELVKQGIAETGAEGPKDMGKVMGALRQKAGDRVDGRRLSAAVKDALAG